MATILSLKQGETRTSHGPIPHLLTLPTIWDPYTHDQINQIDKIQGRRARFVFNDYDYISHPYDMIAKLEWDSLSFRRQERRLLVLHKALHDHLSIPATKILRPTTRPSRSSNDRTFQQIQTRKDCFEYSFFPRTKVDWNKRPYHVISTEQPTVFKTKLHNHLRE